MKKTLLLLALVLWTGMQVVIAQSRVVTGTILDEQGNPVAAASVKIKGTQGGTFTGMNGTFEVTIPEGVSPEIEVEAMGFAKRSIMVGDLGEEEQLTIRLTVSSTQIDEVMIIGYGETTKERYVGVADKIGSERIAKFPVSNITKAIEGAAPGLQISNGGGQPGSGAGIRIRGIGSVSASSSPLYVVDGSPYVGDISSINPLDIDNITILKDATATSLYGSRGSNGVIMITTKRGTASADGKARLTVDGKVGIVKRGLPNYKVIKSEKDFYEMTWEAYRNQLAEEYGGRPQDYEKAGRVASGLLPAEGPGIIEALGGYNSYDVPDDQLIDPITGKLVEGATLKYHDDWEEELSRTGLRQDYNVALSGGSQRTNYYFSLGYLKEEGYIKHSNYDRFSGRMNINTEASDWLKFGMNLSASLSNQESTENGGTAGGYNPFFAARTNAPIYPVYYRDSLGNKEIDPLTGNYKYDWGSLTQAPESSLGTRATLPNANVLGALDLDERSSKMINIVASPYMEVQLAKHLKFRTNLNANLYTSNSTSYRNMLYGQFASAGGSSTKSNMNMLTYTWNQLLTYTRTIGAHNFDVLVGHENYYLNIIGASASRQGLPFPGNTNITGAATPLGSDSYENNHRIESYLSRINYDFNNKYFFTASLRFDGSSRFAPDTRWGSPFWAVGGSWMINRESFLQSVSWLDMLKIKASYGTQGNEALLSGSSQNYYAWQALYRLDFPNGENAGAIVSALGSSSLGWERSGQLNLGVEFSTLNNRIGGEINYFIRTNADLLYNLPMPLSTGMSSRPANTLTMQNKGVELNLNIDAVRSNNFNWHVNLNLTHYKNMITKMPEGQDSLLTGQYQWKEGRSIYDYYLLESVIDAETGYEKFVYYDESGARQDTTLSSYALDNNGREYRGSALPDLMGAITNNFSYKGFDLSFMFSFGIGGKYYDRIYQNLMQPGSFGSNWHEDILNRWTPDNKNSEVPRVEMQNLNMGGQSTRWLVDASYLNLRNVSLGYTFTQPWVKDFGLESLRIYGSADNLWLLSKRQGMDPQGTFGGNPDYIYSPAKTFMFGISVGL